MQEVIKEFDDAMLLIVGEGILKPELEGLAKKLKLTNNIQFLPEVHNKDLAPYYCLSDIFVLPSIYKSEAFGIVQLEAMACSKPVISTNVRGSGISFVNKNNETGIVVEPRNSEELASAIIKLLKNKSLCKKFGNNGIMRVKNIFSKEIMVKNILDIYTSISKHQKES